MLRRKESYFYIFLGFTMIILFSSHLVIRLFKQQIIGPLILIVYLVVACYSFMLIREAKKRSVESRTLLFSFFIIFFVFPFIIECSLNILDFPPEVPLHDLPSNNQLKKLEKLISLRKSNVNAYPWIAPNQLRYIEETFKTDLYFGNVGNADIVGGEEKDGFVTYHSDSNGFRNPLGLYEGT